jgi:hypothetical protein
LLSPFVLAELDYLVASRVGPAARTSLLEEVQRGAYLQAVSAVADAAGTRPWQGRPAPLPGCVLIKHRA